MLNQAFAFVRTTLDSVSTLLSPFIFFPDLGLLFWSEVVDNTKSLSDFLWCFSWIFTKITFDHGSYFGATEFNKWLDIEVVGWEEQFKKFLLIGEIDEVFIPGVD